MPHQECLEGMDELSARRELENMLDRCREVGWTVTKGRKHVKVRPKKGPVLVVPATPGEGRAIANCRALFKRAMRAEQITL